MDQTQSFNVNMYTKKTNAYIIFCGDNRNEIREKFPSLPQLEITKKLAEIWKTLDNESKQKYKDKAEKMNYYHVLKKMYDLECEVKELKSKLKKIKDLSS